MSPLRVACQIPTVMVACGVGVSLKTTLSFYQPGVSAGLCERRGFLSKTHDSHFLFLAYDLFLKMAQTQISCKWPIAS